jgi:hypothetical protein
MGMKSLRMGLFVLLLAATGSAQTNPPPIKGMASTVGLYVYPRNQQTNMQQLTDESQCYSNAKTQTGYDPNATTTAPAPKDAKQSGGNDVAHSAARGAVISGATGGDPITGARRGAMLGSIKAKRQQKEEQQQEQKQAQAKAAAQQPLDNFKRSVSACLDARGYSVK